VYPEPLDIVSEYDATAKYINCKDAPERRVARLREPMIDEKTARVFIVCGAAAAIFGALGAVFLSLQGAAFVNLPIAALFLGLAYGIYRRSRACAVLAAVLYLFQRLGMYAEAAAMQQVRGGSVMTGFWISVAVFTTLYALGIIGTFSSQPGVTKPGAPAGPGAPATGDDSVGRPEQSPQPSQPKSARRRAPSVPAAHELCNACGGTGKIRDTDVPCAWCNGAGYI